MVLGSEESEVVSNGQRYKASTQILQLEVVLASFENGKLSPGRFEFPFSADVPATLPSSMVARSEKEGLCRISYRVKARLQRPGVLNPDIKAQRPFKVYRPLRDAPPLPLGACDIRHLKYKRCLGRGCVVVALRLGDGVLVPGRSVPIELGCDNRSGVRIRRVVVTVREVVEWRSGQRGTGGRRRNRASRVVAELVVADPARDLAGPCLAQRSWWTTSAAPPRRRGDLEAFARQLLDVRPAGSSAPPAKRLLVRSDARETYEGGLGFPLPSLITCTHVLSVHFETGPGLTSPRLQVPVRVVRAAGVPPPATVAIEGVHRGPNHVAGGRPVQARALRAQPVPRGRARAGQQIHRAEERHAGDAPPPPPPPAGTGAAVAVVVAEAVAAEDTEEAELARCHHAPAQWTHVEVAELVELPPPVAPPVAPPPAAPFDAGTGDPGGDGSHRRERARLRQAAAAEAWPSTGTSTGRKLPDTRQRRGPKRRGAFTFL